MVAVAFLLKTTASFAQPAVKNEKLVPDKSTAGNAAGIIKQCDLLINKGEYDSAIVLCKQGISLTEKTPKEQLRISTLYNYIGASFQFKGDFDSALHYFYRAIDNIGEKQQGSLQLMRIYNNVSLAFNRTLNNEKAIFYLEKSEQIAKKNGWNNLLPALLLNKGRIYKEEKRYVLAEQTFIYALGLCDTVPDIEKACGIPPDVIKLMIFINLGQLNIDQMRIAKAKAYLDQAIPLAVDVNPYYQIPLHLALARVCFHLKDYNHARDHAAIAITKSEASKISDGLAEGHLLMSKICKAQLHFQQAYDHLSKAYLMEESIRGVNRTKDSRLLEVKYRTAQKDKEIAERKLLVINKDRLLKNKNVWIGGISFGSLSILAIFLIVFKNYRNRQRLQEQKILSIQQARHIELLRATAEGEEKERTRIAGNLHDGIGSIISAAKMNFSTIHTLAADRHIFDRSMNLLNEAAFEIRSIAHNLMPQLLLREGLVTATKDFCERVSNSKLLKIEYQAYGDFKPQDANFELTVYRIIQELVNNIIKHSGAQKALVQLSMTDNLLAITVEDNGIGFAKKGWSEGSGLKNMEDTVSSLNGMLAVDSTPQRGTQVYIEFELQKKPDAI